MLERAKQRWRQLRQGLTRAVAWDLLMVYLATLNVGLIVFDMTYFWLRPFYARQLPVVTRVYDPVKGIEPEPVTQQYLELVDALTARPAADLSSSASQETLRELRNLSIEIIDDNPFERSGLERNRIRMFKGMQAVLAGQGFASVGEGEAEVIADLYWSLERDSRQLRERVQKFETLLAPLLEANFFRRYDLSGKLTDHFWLIDLPFLVIFIIEFFVSWYLAVRRQTYPRWFMYPIVHWYDVLGIMPFRQLRIFRLFRVVSIYLRLSRSEHTFVGEDPISRTIAFFSNIVSEEISDMVALRILNETQDELDKGTHKRIIHSVAAVHRDKLAMQLAQQTSEMLSSAEVRERAQGFLEANLQQAVESADALRFVPLPDVVLRPLITSIGQVVFDAFADTLSATVASEEGQESLRAMIRDVIDALVLEITEGELEQVVREISVQVIEEVKQTVSVRKWALPDQARRNFLTRELVE